MSVDIFTAIIFGIVGIGLLTFGIIMRKKNRIPLQDPKRKRESIDDPKQASLIFILLGLVGIVFAINPLLYIVASEEIADSVSRYILLANFLLPLAAIAAALYGLINKRVFGCKNTPAVRPHIKKYYKQLNSSLMLAGISAILAMIATDIDIFSNEDIALLICWGVVGASLFIFAIISSKLEISYKQSLKKSK